MDVSSIWNQFLIKIKELVPMHVHKKFLKENYNDLVEKTFTDITGSIFKFEYFTEDEYENNFTIDTNNVGIPSNQDFDSNIKPEYTFENYIVGQSNKFARTTALAVAEKPGMMYNPLFIYGSSGLGKTHLMHAIGNYILKNSKKRVLYVTSEQFVNEFIELYRKNKEDNIEEVQHFKKKYRDLDVLMIDDIQYLQIANSAQQEFFNTFNELHGNNKQIIISSDRSPDDLNKLEQRLQTRFNWGITTDILPPDFKLRIDIINKKIEGNPLASEFPDEVKEYIASNCSSDIRKLEGSITRIMAYATIMNSNKIDLELATEALRDYFVKSNLSKSKIDQVMQLVASTYNITIEDLKSKRRMAKISVPRQVAMYICRTHLNETLPKIGIEFGGKDHSTVMHSVDKIASEIKKDKNLEIQIQKIIDQIK